MSTLDLTRDWLVSVLGPYPSRDHILPEILGVLQTHRTLAVKTDAYTFDSGQTALLVHLHGTLPIAYRGATYQIPIALWVPHEYPRAPPLAYVVPTRDMGVRKSREVDPSGRVRDDVVAEWWRAWPTKDMSTLLKHLTDVFSAAPPVYAKPPEPAASSSRPASVASPVQQAAQPSASTPPPPPVRPYTNGQTEVLPRRADAAADFRAAVASARRGGPVAGPALAALAACPLPPGHAPAASLLPVRRGPVRHAGLAPARLAAAAVRAPARPAATVPASPSRLDGVCGGGWHAAHRVAVAVPVDGPVAARRPARAWPQPRCTATARRARTASRHPARARAAPARARPAVLAEHRAGRPPARAARRAPAETSSAVPAPPPLDPPPAPLGLAAAAPPVAPGRARAPRRPAGRPALGPARGEGRDGAARGCAQGVREHGPQGPGRRRARAGARRRARGPRRGRRRRDRLRHLDRAQPADRPRRRGQCDRGHDLSHGARARRRARRPRPLHQDGPHARARAVHEARARRENSAGHGPDRVVRVVRVVSVMDVAGTGRQEAKEESTQTR